MIQLKEDTLFNKFKEYGNICIKNGFVQDKENDKFKKVIETVEEDKVGVCVVGNPGSGKTLLFELLSEIIHPQSSQHFIKLRAIDVVLRFNKDGHSLFKKWENKNVLFDDLGAEERGHYYAERVEVFILFIQIRYELYKKFGVKTHFTSNLLIEEISTRYGLRCKSRLLEMCDVFVIGGDFRYTDRRTYRNNVEFPRVLHKQIRTPEDIEWEEMYKRAKENSKNDPLSNKIKSSGERLRERIGVDEEKKRILLNTDSLNSESKEREFIIEFSNLPSSGEVDGKKTVNYKGFDLTCLEYIEARKKEI